MSRAQIFKILYAAIGIFSAYLLAGRVVEGEWLSALIPLAVLVLCVYRFMSMGTEEE